MTDRPHAVPNHVVPRQLGSELVLLDLKSGAYFGLDGIGARIWHLIEQGETTESIGRVLADEYDIAEETARQDTEELVADLVEKGLLSEPGTRTP